MRNVESIKKALEGVTPERVERLWWFLHILSKSSGTTNADDDKWNWINAFCTDYEDDTFNSAKNIGFISVTHNDLMETSTARLTDPGKAFVAYFDKAPSASANTTLEALQRENEALREALKPFALVAEYDIGEDETDNDRFQPMSFENSRVKLLTVGDLRRARTALASAGGEHHADK